MDTCILKLYNELKNGRQYLMEKDRYTIDRAVLHNESMFPKCLQKESAYFSKTIKRKIIDEGTYLITSSCKMLGKEFHLNVVLCTPLDTVDVEKMFFSMYLWLYVINVIATDNSHKCSRIMEITIFMADVSKELPSMGSEIIGPEHVNSGYTYTCKEHNEIVIYREEEWFKVFVHESFHSYGLDFSAYNMDKYQDRLTNMFNIDTEILIYEAYCETWARVINIMMHHFMENPTQRFSSFKKTCVADFQKEAVHAMTQSCKILKYMGLSYKILISKDTSLQKCSRTLYKEKTNVFCYYILTSLLLFFLDDLMKWCCEHNYDCLCIPKNLKSIDRFIEFIEKRYDHEEFTDLLDECVDQLDDTSLRMTSFFVDPTK